MTLNKWGLPGGNAEPNEDFETVIRREVIEETGLTLGAVTPFGLSCNPDIETVTFPNGDCCQFFVLNYVSRCDSDLPKVCDDESERLEWFDWNKLPAMLLNMSAAIDAYHRYVSTGDFQVY